MSTEQGDGAPEASSPVLEHDFNGASCSACGVDEASSFANAPCEPDDARIPKYEPASMHEAFTDGEPPWSMHPSAAKTSTAGWTKIGDAEYRVEWSEQAASEGRPAKREVEVLRRAGGSNLVLLRPAITSTVDEGTATIHLGQTELSLHDAIAVTIALTEAIEHAEQHLTDDGSATAADT